MMLDYLQLPEAASLVRQAVDWTMSHGFVSRDIDPVNSYSTSTIGDLIRDFIDNKIPSSVNKTNIALSKSTII
jgi:3-isopropylmalate dehydrogenase